MQDKYYKYVSLIVLLVQNVMMVLTIRYSRMNLSQTDPNYLTSVVILFSEILKFFVCNLIVYFQQGSFCNYKMQIKCDIIEKPIDLLKISLPGALFTVQNNLTFVALSFMDAASFQVLSQLKILTTAVMSTLMLQTKLDKFKWISLLLLMFGVALIEIQKSGTSSTFNKNYKNQIIGQVCVVSICLISAFSNVYLEKMLKSSNVTLWMRNIQLSFFGIIFSFLNVCINDSKAIKENGWLQGINSLVILIICIAAVGGLVIAAVMKYADNIIKCYATAIAIVFGSLVSHFIYRDLSLNIYFNIGVLIVIFATYLYGHKFGSKNSSENKHNGQKN